MRKAQAITELVRNARESAATSRSYRRKYGYFDSMSRWHSGMASGFLSAARILSGRASARLRNAMRRAA